MIALACASSEEMRALAAALHWEALPAGDTDLAWQPQGMDARVGWRELDNAFGVFSFEGNDGDLAAADLGMVLNLLDDVDAMQAIAAAPDPPTLESWARRLGAFVAGSQVYETTAAVLRGLLGCDSPDFAAAVVAGLQRARWQGLIEALKATAERRPDLAAGCHHAIGSIRSNPV